LASPVSWAARSSALSASPSGSAAFAGSAPPPHNRSPTRRVDSATEALVKRIAVDPRLMPAFVGAADEVGR